MKKEQKKSRAIVILLIVAILAYIIIAGVFASAALAIIPLIIFFFLVEIFIQNSIIRKILWIVYGIIVIALYLNSTNTLAGFFQNILFPVAVFITCMLLYMFDSQIRSWLEKSKLLPAKKY